MKHVHAENMLAYAQDAMETDKPWGRWEYCSRIENLWRQAQENPTWSEENQYRRKPRTININGFEVPEPVREPLENEQKYYIPSLAFDAILTISWGNDKDENEWLKKGLIHLTSEAAEIHAKALLSFTQNN